MQAIRRIGILMAVMMLLVACATTGTSPTSMTPKQQATIWSNVYNAEFADAMAVMKNTTSTVAQKDMAQKKKVVLTKVWPLLKAYVSLVDAGGTPALAQSTAITDLINELSTLAGG